MKRIWLWSAIIKRKPRIGSLTKGSFFYSQSWNTVESKMFEVRNAQIVIPAFLSFICKKVITLIGL